MMPKPHLLPQCTNSYGSTLQNWLHQFVWNRLRQLLKNARVDVFESFASTAQNRLRQHLEKVFCHIGCRSIPHERERERERERKKEGERKKERERNKRNNKIKRKVWKSRERKISAQSYEHFTIINYDSGVLITCRLFRIYARRGLIRLATGEKERTEDHNIKRERTEQKRKERDRTKDHCKW